jgi:hypothetical protein
MTTEKITRNHIEEVRHRFIEENLLLTPVEVAALLSISVRSVFRLVEDGTLPKVNGHANAGKTRIRAITVRYYRESMETKDKDEG